MSKRQHIAAAKERYCNSLELQGSTTEGVADLLDVSYTTITIWRRELGLVKPRKLKKTNAELDRRPPLSKAQREVCGAMNAWGRA